MQHHTVTLSGFINMHRMFQNGCRELKWLQQEFKVRETESFREAEEANTGAKQVSVGVR